jgi:hypothetical protein
LGLREKYAEAFQCAMGLRLASAALATDGEEYERRHSPQLP